MEHGLTPNFRGFAWCPIKAIRIGEMTGAVVWNVDSPTLKVLKLSSLLRSLGVKRVKSIIPEARILSSL